MEQYREEDGLYIKAVVNGIDQTGILTEIYKHEITGEFCGLVEFDPPILEKGNKVTLICTWMNNITMVS